MISPTEFILSIGSESVLFAHKADLLMKREQVEEALELCEEGVKRFPFYAEGYVQLARCHQMLEQDEQAVEAYKKALFFQPGHSKALKGLAYLYYKLREKELGERTLLSAYLYDPFDRELHEFLEDEGLLTKIYTPPAFAEDTEEEKEEATGFDLEEILDDSRLTPEDERQNIIEKIDEFPQEEPEDLSAGESLTDFDASKLEEELAANAESHFDLESDLDEDFEADFFPEDLSEIAPGVGKIPEEEEKKQEPEQQEDSAISEQIDQGRSDVHEGEAFSEWMNDLFKTDEPSTPPENEAKEEENAEQAQAQAPESSSEEPLFDEETPHVLDTALIFNQRRKSELDEPQEDEKTPPSEESGEKPVADFNTLEDDIERISSQDAAKIEQNMVEPKSETSEELDEVIKRIQESTEKKKEDSSLKQLEFDRKQAKAVEEDAVDIDDILNNPSLLTPTFGEILIAQHKFEDALKVFRALIKKDPENPRFQKKIEFLNKLVSAKK